MFRSAIVIAALVASVSAIAQALPLHGVARYGEARFAASESAQAVPSMPLWATFTLAVTLWAVVYLIRKKESAND
jgi:hypothetical protein